MSDFDSADISTSSARFTDDLNKELGEVLGAQFERSKKLDRDREGLPPGYRMRADTHYVEQLTARSADLPLRSIAIEDIDLDEPAGSVDEDTLQPLVHSVATHGVVQPLLVRREGTGYRLIAGRRRLAAARTAKLPRVPCLVHQVDDEQAESLALADNLRVIEEAQAPRQVFVESPAAPTISDASNAELFTHLSQSVSTMRAAAAMLVDRGTPMAQKIALDLLGAEIRRAGWQLRATAILENRHAWHFRRSMFGSVIARACDELAIESHFTGIELTKHISDWNVAAAIDEEAVLCALTGAILATAGLAEHVDARAITLSISGTAERPAIDVTQTGVALLSGIGDRFFDAQWTQRPGGWPAAVGAAAAKAVAERHGGDAVLLDQEGHGSTIRLTFGQ